MYLSLRSLKEWKGFTYLTGQSSVFQGLLPMVGSGYLSRVELLSPLLRPDALENQGPHYFHLIELSILTFLLLNY